MLVSMNDINANLLTEKRWPARLATPGFGSGYQSNVYMGQLDLGPGFNLNIQPLVGALLSGGSMRAIAAKIVQGVEFRSQVTPSVETKPFGDDPGPVGAHVEDRTAFAPKFELPDAGAPAAPVFAPGVAQAPAQAAPPPPEPSLSERLTKRFLDFTRPSFYVRTPGGTIPIEPYGAPVEDNSGKVFAAGAVALGLLGYLTYRALKPCPTCRC